MSERSRLKEERDVHAPEETGYDPAQDPDSDPEQLGSHDRPQQPDQAEGDDVK